MRLAKYNRDATLPKDLVPHLLPSHLFPPATAAALALITLPHASTALLPSSHPELHPFLSEEEMSRGLILVFSTDCVASRFEINGRSVSTQGILARRLSSALFRIESNVLDASTPASARPGGAGAENYGDAQATPRTPGSTRVIIERMLASPFSPSAFFPGVWDVKRPWPSIVEAEETKAHVWLLVSFLLFVFFFLFRRGAWWVVGKEEAEGRRLTEAHHSSSIIHHHLKVITVMITTLRLH